VASAEVFDRIEFGLVISLNGSWHASTIAIAINGRDLCDIIARVEAPQAACHGNPRAAGGYHDLSLGQLRASVREHLLGEPGDTQCVTAGKSVLLICTCGEIGCQAVAVRIQDDGRIVVWRDAENTNQPWSYAALSEARFDRRQYLRAISRLEAELNEAAAHAAFGGWRPGRTGPAV
jgi:hypothetical protein